MKTNRDKFTVCKNCVMDTSDSLLRFDENGVCDYCQNYNINIKNRLENLSKSNNDLDQIVNKIKSKKNGKYDCLIGISGGVDSCFLAHFVKTELNLNPLVVHVDTGWNSTSLLITLKNN